MTVNISRRTALRRAAFVRIGAAAVGSQVLSLPARAADRAPDPETVHEEAIGEAQERNKRVLSGVPSKNGWEMEKLADDRGSVYTRPVPGTPLEGVRMRMGDVETVLVHVITRFHYEIGSLRAGEVTGWQARVPCARASPSPIWPPARRCGSGPGPIPPARAAASFPWRSWWSATSSPSAGVWCAGVVTTASRTSRSSPSTYRRVTSA